MTISLKRSKLSKPKKGERINHYDLAYVRARNKNKAHSKLLELFKESGISKSDLAKMLGKKPEQLTRWLSGPGNLTLDTLSDLIFAINGNLFIIECKNELDKATSNNRRPDWCIAHDEATRGAKWQLVIPSQRQVSISVAKPEGQKEEKYEIGSSGSGKERAEVY